MRPLAAFLLGSILMSAGSASATLYTHDPNLADFANTGTAFATLSNFGAGDVSSPYTPTFATLNEGLRVYAGGSLPGLSGTDFILATFKDAVSIIRVYPSIDHFGLAYDGFQYDIYGSTDGMSWTPLFNDQTVAGASEPFTIGTFTGTAPFEADDVLTPGAGPNGTDGYIADFKFAAAYKYYAFGPSTEAINSGNVDQELSGVAAIPEPGTLSVLGAVLAGLGALLLRRKVKSLT